jgi:hypothetical protein
VEIVINGCFGGFSLSRKAVLRLAELGQQDAIEELESEFFKNNDYDGFLRSIPRDDPLLVKVVTELGEKANGECARLHIADIPDNVDWEIDEYDGNETVEEKHRRWS